MNPSKTRANASIMRFIFLYLLFTVIVAVTNAEVPSTDRPDESYTQDTHHAYFSGVPIKGADVKTFQVLPGHHGWYATDAQHVYIRGYSTPLDPRNLSIIGQCYAKDRRYVFYHNGSDESDRVNGASPESFTTLGSAYDCEWAEDNEHVYFGRTLVQRADPKTFVACNSRFGKDAAHVYLMEQVVADADPKTFTGYQEQVWFGKDKYHVFTSTRPIPGADPNTFTISEGQTKSGQYFNAKDKKHKYFYNKVVE